MRVLFYLVPLIFLAFAKKNSTDLDKLIQRIIDENGPIWPKFKKLYEDKAALTNTTTAAAAPSTTATPTTAESAQSRRDRLNKMLLALPEVQAQIAGFLANGIGDISFYEHNGICYFHNAKTWEVLFTFICPLF